MRTSWVALVALNMSTHEILELVLLLLSFLLLRLALQVFVVVQLPLHQVSLPVSINQVDLVVDDLLLPCLPLVLISLPHISLLTFFCACSIFRFRASRSTEFMNLFSNKSSAIGRERSGCVTPALKRICSRFFPRRPGDTSANLSRCELVGVLRSSAFGECEIDLQPSALRSIFRSFYSYCSYFSLSSFFFYSLVSPWLLLFPWWILAFDLI